MEREGEVYEVGYVLAVALRRNIANIGTLGNRGCVQGEILAGLPAEH